MSRTNAIWRHPLLEGLAVLVGILIAFGIDAWWQERSERVTEQAYLEALNSELQDARAFFTAHSGELSADVALAWKVLEALNSADHAGLSDDSLNALALELGPLSIRSPPRAALDDLISSGGTALVRNAAVRRAIASYERSLSSDERTQESMVELWLTHLAPYRYDHATINYDDIPGVPVRDVSAEVDRTAYIGNRTYANLLMARILRVVDVQESHRESLEELDRVLALLDQELEGVSTNPDG